MSDVRRSGRAVVLDEDDRILLLHGPIQERPQRLAWYLPGGRLEHGESYEDATIRELAEELGLRHAELGRWVWTRHGLRPRGDDTVPTTSHFFLVRTTAFVPDTAGIGASEQDVDWRWWTVDELDAMPPGTTIPRQLAQLLRQLIDGPIPDSPIDVSDPPT